MFFTKVSILLCVLFFVYESCYCQVSFSTNWGTGKRSNIFSAPAGDQSSLCLSRLEFNILKDLSNLVRREIRQATKCLQVNKEYEYEYTNNQRFIEQ